MKRLATEVSNKKILKSVLVMFLKRKKFVLFSVVLSIFAGIISGNLHGKPVQTIAVDCFYLSVISVFIWSLLHLFVYFYLLNKKYEPQTLEEIQKTNQLFTKLGLL